MVKNSSKRVFRTVYHEIKLETINIEKKKRKKFYANNFSGISFSISGSIALGGVFLSIDSSMRYSVLIRSRIATRIASERLGNLLSDTKISNTFKYDSGKFTEINFITITLVLFDLMNKYIYESDIFKDLVEIDPKKSDEISYYFLLIGTS